MAPDPWPDEPEEVDPEARWGDPERDLPKPIRIPEAQQPRVPDETVEGELPRTFWASVIFINVAVFALSLGPMLIFFRDQWMLGLGLIGGGLLLLGRTYQLYRSVKNQPTTDDGTDGGGGDGDNGRDGDDEGKADAGNKASDEDATAGVNPADPERNP